MKSLPFVLAVMTAMLGCGGTPKDPNAPGGGSGSAAAGKPGAAGDVTLEIPPIAIQGLVFEPEALGRPGMPIYMPKNPKQTLTQQKIQYGKAPNATMKQVEAAVLATMLYNESKTKTGADQTKLIEEARGVLLNAKTAAGAKVEDVTLRLLGSYELILDNYVGAEEAWKLLVEKAPKDPNIGEHRAWWIYSLLRQYKNTEALDLAKTETPTAKQPLLAYVIAWAKWRGGDDAGAWQAMAAAAEGWGTNGNKEVIERDIFLFASRSAVARDQVKSELYKIFGAKQPGPQYEVLSKLGGQAYQFAGRWNDAIATLDEALKMQTNIPDVDKVRLKYAIAEFLVPLDQPDAAARNAMEAMKAMPACKTCKTEEKEQIVTQIYGIARTFHLLYATANDVRFYQPAYDLYRETIPLLQNTQIRTQAKSDMDTLEKTLKNTKVGTGTHDKQAITLLVNRHKQEVQACAEDQLAANPKIAGQITIELESDATGAIKGASSEPKAGVADLSAIAGCIVASAKDWKLPKRGMAGNTRIKLVYNVSKK